MPLSFKIHQLLSPEEQRRYWHGRVAPPSLSELPQGVSEMALVLLGSKEAAEVGERINTLVIDDIKAEREERRLFVSTTLKQMGTGFLQPEEAVLVGMKRFMQLVLCGKKTPMPEHSELAPEVPNTLLPNFVARMDTAAIVCGVDGIAPEWCYRLAREIDEFTLGPKPLTDALRTAVGGVAVFLVGLARLSIKVHGSKKSGLPAIDRAASLVSNTSGVPAAEIKEQVMRDCSLVKTTLELIIYDQTRQRDEFDVIESLQGRTAVLASFVLILWYTPWVFTTPFSFLLLEFALGAASDSDNDRLNRVYAEQVMVASRVCV